MVFSSVAFVMMIVQYLRPDAAGTSAIGFLDSELTAHNVDSTLGQRLV
jgi:hypothetical protein